MTLTTQTLTAPDIDHTVWKIGHWPHQTSNTLDIHLIRHRPHQTFTISRHFWPPRKISVQNRHVTNTRWDLKVFRNGNDAKPSCDQHRKENDYIYTVFAWLQSRKCYFSMLLQEYMLISLTDLIVDIHQTRFSKQQTFTTQDIHYTRPSPQHIVW